MTQLYGEDGNVVPVTAVLVTPGVVTQVKTESSEGYAAVQVGYEYGSKHPSKVLSGHVKGALKKPKLFEFRAEGEHGFTVGQRLDASSFVPGDSVNVSGTSKGRGFQGVVKRHHFHGAPKTHGHKHDLRAPGSIGSTDAQRVFPGRRMAGRMGADKVTISNLKIASIDAEKGVVYIRGAVPGARNGIVIIRGA